MKFYLLGEEKNLVLRIFKEYHGTIENDLNYISLYDKIFNLIEGYNQSYIFYLDLNYREIIVFLFVLYDCLLNDSLYGNYSKIEYVGERLLSQLNDQIKKLGIDYVRCN